MKIVVLAGGLSTERDVSINSGKEITKALIEKGHKVVLLDVFMGYEKKLDNIESLFDECRDLTQSGSITNEVPDLKKIKASRKDQSSSYFGENVIEICKSADICFLGLHGGEGENGQLQAAFDMLGIKYTGTDYLSAAVAMDKGVTKSVFIDHNVPTPKSVLFTKGDQLSEYNSFPCVVKPCSAGSSVGVHIVENKDEFVSSMEDAFSYEDNVLVEEYVKGREFSIGVIDNKAVPVIEIIPKNGWFDYENKYQAGATDEICPAQLDKDIAKKMQKEAEHVFSVLGLKVYSRIDFLLNDKNEFFCLEANTLPGMTPASLLPKEANAAGMSYPELCETIVNLSLKKYKG